MCKGKEIVCPGGSFDVGYCSQPPGYLKSTSAGVEVIDVDDDSPEKCTRSVPEAAVDRIAPRTLQEVPGQLDCENCAVGKACATEGESESEACLDLTRCESTPDDESDDKVETLSDEFYPDSKQQGSNSSQFLTRLLEIDSAAQEQLQSSAMETFKRGGVDDEERGENGDVDERSCGEYEYEYEDDEYSWEDSATDCGHASTNGGDVALESGVRLEDGRAASPASQPLGWTGAREAIDFQVHQPCLVPLLELWALLYSI